MKNIFKLSKVRHSKRAGKFLGIRANSMVETILVIVLALLAFISAQPYLYRAFQGFWKGQIDQIKDPPSFEVSLGEPLGYIRTPNIGYDIFADQRDTAVASGFESVNQTVNAGNTTISYTRSTVFSGGQSEPVLSSDTARIRLE